MNIIKYISIILLIIIIIKIIYDEFKKKENYDNVTKKKFDDLVVSMNDVIHQEQDKKNIKKENYMRFTNLRVTQKLKPTKINIKNSIKFGTHNITISNNGELIIKDSKGTTIWTSKHLYNGSLYDASGRYTFFVDNFNKEYPLSVPSTHMFDTENKPNFEDWTRVNNIAVNGGFIDVCGNYKLQVSNNVWYNTSGIYMTDLHLPNTKTILGLKQGKIQYENCYLMAPPESGNRALKDKNFRTLDNSRDSDCDPIYPDNMVYGCYIYFIVDDITYNKVLRDHPDISEDDAEREILIYPYGYEDQSNFTTAKKAYIGAMVGLYLAAAFLLVIAVAAPLAGALAIGAGVSVALGAGFGVAFSPRLDGAMYRAYRIQMQMGCGIYKSFKVSWEWVEDKGGVVIHWFKNVGEDVGDAVGWSRDTAGTVSKWTVNAAGEAISVVGGAVDAAGHWIENAGGTVVGGLSHLDPTTWG